MKLQEAEKELDTIREEKNKYEDEVSKIKFQKSFLEKDLDDMKHQQQKGLAEQKALYEKELHEIKNSVNVKIQKVKSLEDIIDKKDREITEEKDSNQVYQRKINSLEDAEKVSEEYKMDLESKIREMAEMEAKLKNQISSMKNIFTEENVKKTQHQQSEHEKQMADLREENEKRISELMEENNSVIMEDLKLFEKNRKEIEDLKSKTESMQSNIESLLEEKEGKEQEYISLQILSSEKDESLEIEKRNLQKCRLKYEKLKEKMIGLIELKDGLDNRVTVTEMKYFTLEKDLSLKQAEIAELLNKINSKETEAQELKEKIKEIEGLHGEELEKANKAKEDIENILENEKNKIELEKAEIKKTKQFLLQQIEQIRKKSGDKILLAVETIEIS